MSGILSKNHLMKRKKSFLKGQLPSWEVQKRKRFHQPEKWIEKHLSGTSYKIDAMSEKITLNNITTINKVMYCGRIITSELLGMKNSKSKQNNYPIWKKKTRKTNYGSM